MLATVGRISEAGSGLQHNGGAAGAGVEDVSRKGQLLMLESNKESPLDIELGLKYLCALRHSAEVEPAIELVSYLRPVVIEISRLGCGIEHVFVVQGEVQF